MSNSKKIKTRLQAGCFAFQNNGNNNHITCYKTVEIEWYCLKGAKGVCLNEQQANDFFAFVKNNNHVFSDNCSISECNSDDAPIDDGTYQDFPFNFILKKQVELLDSIFDTMQIRLLDTHTYNLPFSVIGKITNIY